MSINYGFSSALRYSASDSLPNSSLIRLTGITSTVDGRSGFLLSPTAVSGTHSAFIAGVFNATGLVRVAGLLYRPSSNGGVVSVRVSNGPSELITDIFVPENQWTPFVVHGVVRTLTGGGFNGSFLGISLLTASSNVFVGNPDDYLAISDLRVDQLTELPANSLVPLGRLISGGV